MVLYFELDLLISDLQYPVPWSIVCRQEPFGRVRERFIIEGYIRIVLSLCLTSCKIQFRDGHLKEFLSGGRIRDLLQKLGHPYYSSIQISNHGYHGSEEIRDLYCNHPEDLVKLVDEKNVSSSRVHELSYENESLECRDFFVSVVLVSPK